MTVLTNSLESGVDGVSVSTNNSGGISGSSFDTVTIGSGGTLSYSRTVSHSGFLSANIQTTTSNSTFMQWAASMGVLSQVWFRCYMYITANPAASVFIVRTLGSGTACGQIVILSTGQIRALNSPGATVFTTTNTVPVNQWFRIEGFITGSATVGQIEVKLFNITDSIVPTETQTSAANLNTNGNQDTYRFGCTTAVPNVASFWMDDIGISSTSYIGPFIYTPPAPAAYAVRSFSMYTYQGSSFTG